MKTRTKGVGQTLRQRDMDTLMSFGMSRGRARVVSDFIDEVVERMFVGELTLKEGLQFVSEAAGT